MTDNSTTGLAMSAKDHRRKRRRQRGREALRGYLFLAPWLIGVACFVCYPLFYSVYISFNKVSIAKDGSGLAYEWIGWGNYRYSFLRDNVFPIEMLSFLRELLFIVPITVIFSLLVAVMLNQKFRGRMFFRMIFFLPVIFATGEVLTELFSQGQGAIPFGDQYDVEALIYGIFSPNVASTIMSVISRFVIILWSSGIQIIIFLAAFQTIPQSAFEAARIDGVTPWESFWKITFPVIVPFITLNLIYTLVDQSTNPFNPIIAHILKNMSDAETGYGYASALGWIYCAITLVPILILARFGRPANKRKG